MAEEDEALRDKYGINVRARLSPDELAEVDREAARASRSRSQQIRHYVRVAIRDTKTEGER